MNLRTFLTRLRKDEQGSHTTEMALAIALFALVAGFGFFTYGDALLPEHAQKETPPRGVPRQGRES